MSDTNSNNNNNNITIEYIKDHDDGSATILFNMNAELVQVFAKIGLLKVLTDSAAAAIKEHEDCADV
jgi:hypothetical protein